MTSAFGLAPPQKNWGEKWMHHNYGAFFVGIKILPNEMNMGVSKNSGTPKSSISIKNHPFWVPLFLETPIWTWTFQFQTFPKDLSTHHPLGF